MKRLQTATSKLKRGTSECEIGTVRTIMIWVLCISVHLSPIARKDLCAQRFVYVTLNVNRADHDRHIYEHESSGLSHPPPSPPPPPGFPGDVAISSCAAYSRYLLWADYSNCSNQPTSFCVDSICFRWNIKTLSHLGAPR